MTAVSNEPRAMSCHPEGKLTSQSQETLNSKQETLYLLLPEALPSRKNGLILHVSRVNPIIVTFLFSNKYTHISEVTLAFSLGLRYLCP